MQVLSLQQRAAFADAIEQWAACHHLGAQINRYWCWRDPCAPCLWHATAHLATGARLRFLLRAGEGGATVLLPSAGAGEGALRGGERAHPSV